MKMIRRLINSSNIEDSRLYGSCLSSSFFLMQVRYEQNGATLQLFLSFSSYATFVFKKPGASKRENEVLAGNFDLGGEPSDRSQRGTMLHYVWQSASVYERVGERRRFAVLSATAYQGTLCYLRPTTAGIFRIV